MAAAPEELWRFSVQILSHLSHFLKHTPSSASHVVCLGSVLGHRYLSGLLVKSFCDYREAENSF